MTIFRMSAAATALSGLLFASGALRAQGADEASALLEAAIHKQVISGDLAAAAAQYESILVRFGDQRHVAGQTLWRLAQCQEQLGQLDKARQSYERLVREHVDQVTLFKAAQARLAALLDVEDWNEKDLTREVIVDSMTQYNPSAEAKDIECCRRLTVFNDLAVFDRQTRQTRRLMTSSRAAAYPVMSPNGQQVAYLSWNGDMIENANVNEGGSSVGRVPSELRIIGINGSDDRSVLRDRDIRWLRPIQWSPDGTAIATLIERTSGLRQLALVSPRDGAVRVLKALPWLTLQNVTFSSDSQFLSYQIATPRDSHELELSVLAIGPAAGPSVERRHSFTLAGQRGVKPSEDDLVVHVLNRLGFGPRPGDIERVKSMGVDAYIDQQLYPEKLADPAGAILADFRSLKLDAPETLAKRGPLVDLANRRRATIFERAEMEARAGDKTNPERSAVRASADPMVDYPADRPIDYEHMTARIIRAVHSSRQLNEVLADFWMNHFNVNLGDHQQAVNYEEQVIRQHAWGKFEDLLRAVAHDPRMSFYLDNWRSSAPEALMYEHVGDMRKTADLDTQVALLERLQAFKGDKGSKGLNENFARELMELHTLGVDGGYTQQDVINVAKILSGWTIRSRGLVNGHEDDGVFMFDPLMHIPGDKTVMGQTFKSGGVDEGEALLTMLAHHPSTARHIATKLARRFIADDPPAAVIENASRVFLRTDGDIREVVRSILMSPEFRSPETMHAKIKKPLELVASALRAVDATFEDLDAYGPFVLAPRQNWVARMGEQLYNHEAPDGNPDVGSAWMNSNALLIRLDFANKLAAEKIVGVKPNLSAADRLLTQLGIPKPTPLQIEQTRAMLQAAGAQAAAPSMGGQQMMMGGGPGAAAEKPPVSTAALTVGAMLGSPQFQKR